MGKLNKKMAISDGLGGWRLRVFHKKAVGKKTSRYLVKCGCCDSSVEIYYDEFGLEINGVNGSLKEWRRILEPLLDCKQNK